jgi:hypothetical protein
LLCFLGNACLPLQDEQGRGGGDVVAPVLAVGKVEVNLSEREVVVRSLKENF